MLHPKAIIKRPDPKRYDTGNVIKADQFAEWRERFVDRNTAGLGFFSTMANLRSSDTVREWGEKMALPDFMRPKLAPAAPAAWPSPAPAAAMPEPSSPALASEDAPAKRLICASCGAKISYPEGKFCWNNAKRFGGLQYCREHQAAFAS